MTFLTLDEVAANARTICPDARTEDSNLFKQWIYWGERQIGLSGLDEDIEEIEFTGTDIRKPEYYASGIDIAAYDSANGQIPLRYKGSSARIHSDPSRSVFDFVSSDLTDRIRAIEVVENPFYFMFEDRAVGLISRVLLRYYRLPFDNEGNIRIPETHIIALMQFCRWNWAMRNGDDKGMEDRAMSNWLREAARARSRNKMPSMLAGKEIARTYMSMIDKVKFDTF